VIEKMNMLGRKDILLIVILAISAVLLAVSRSDGNTGKEVVWDYAFMLIFGSVIGWIIAEAFSWLGNIVGYDVGVPNRGLTSMSKNGLMVLAEKEGIADRKTLEGLTEEDMMILLNNNGGTSTVKKHSGNMIVAIIVRLKEIVLAIVNRIKTILSRIKDIVLRRKKDIVIDKKKKKK
jgi:hypothetical protein